MEERKQILEMLSNGKITVAEADQLLAAVGAEPVAGAKTEGASGAAARPKPKYLRVIVEQSGKWVDGGEQQKVNIRVPMQLLRAGVKLASLIPVEVQGKVNDALNENGVKIDLKNFKAQDLEELVEQLADISIDVEQESQKVRVFCE